MDFLFRQCNPMSVTEITNALMEQNIPLNKRTVYMHVKAFCKTYPDSCVIFESKHQYRRLPVKKYIFYPNLKICSP
ncbi:hypothetical protein C7N43_34535 [Sphingobacteriales bacterium UPWRP_1]|nr:hypothetical protein C7N43_34535 [Sphingobacteriales bacterium UPWRP_1]